MAVTVISTVTVFLFPAISQNDSYHHFADTRTVNGIPNCYNVISNIAFFIIGLIGLRQSTSQTFLKGNNIAFFTGVLLTSIGSSFYHLHPNNEALIWDRLPMTISFMSFLSIVIGQYINEKTGKRILFHLLFIGILSVLYWYKTEMTGQGDLRFYALVQFLPIILIPLIVLLFKKPTNIYYLFGMLGAYIVAKLFEHFDYEVYKYTKTVSGHALKHICAAIAPFFYFYYLNQNRK